METLEVNNKNWKALIKPGKLDVQLSDDKSFAKSKVLDLVFPKYIIDNKEINLDPLDKWDNKEAYRITAKKLNQLFNNNIKTLTLL